MAESILEPERQRAPRSIQCPESDTVGAKKKEYMKKILDQDCMVSSGCQTKSTTLLKNALNNLNSMYLCPHNKRKHRSKFMCHFCYLQRGNKKYATDCAHKHRTHHSRGLCKSCYQKTYYKVVTDLQSGEEQIKEIIDKDNKQAKETASYGKYIQIRENSKRIGKKYRRTRTSKK